MQAQERGHTNFACSQAGPLTARPRPFHPPRSLGYSCLLALCLGTTGQHRCATLLVRRGCQPALRLTAAAIEALDVRRALRRVLFRCEVLLPVSKRLPSLDPASAPLISVCGPHSAPSSRDLNCASLGTTPSSSGWTGGCRLSAALSGGDWRGLEFHAGRRGGVSSMATAGRAREQRRAVIALAATSS